jgi:hypothetical protein
MEGDSTSKTPVQVDTGSSDREEIHGIPDTDFTEKVGVSAVAPKTALSKETSLVIAVKGNLLSDHLVLASLEIELLLVSDNFSNPNGSKQTGSNIIQCDEALRLLSSKASDVNGTSQGEQQQVLVGSDEGDVQQFHTDLSELLLDVWPAIVLFTKLVASLTRKYMKSNFVKKIFFFFFWLDA